jgi:hypothetical protein
VTHALVLLALLGHTDLALPLDTGKLGLCPGGDGPPAFALGLRTRLEL